MNKSKIVVVLFLFLSVSIVTKANGDGVNTLENINGFLIDISYSISPISSMTPKPSPQSMLGAGISFISNETFQMGVRGNMIIPTSKYAEGYTLESDTIDIEYSSYNLNMFVGYLFNLDAINSNISPSLAIGYGKANVDKLDYYSDIKREFLENTNLIIVEPGLSFNYVVDKSFILSLGFSYQMAIPDQLMINYSSKELNMLKFNVGLAFGLLRGGNGGWGGRRR